MTPTPIQTPRNSRTSSPLPPPQPRSLRKHILLRTSIIKPRNSWHLAYNIRRTVKDTQHNPRAPHWTEVSRQWYKKAPYSFAWHRSPVPPPCHLGGAKLAPVAAVLFQVALRCRTRFESAREFDPHALGAPDHGTPAPTRTRCSSSPSTPPSCGATAALSHPWILEEPEPVERPAREEEAAVG